MLILTVCFSGNAKKYDYVYRGTAAPKQLRYLDGMGPRGPWYQPITVVGARTVEPENVPQYVTKELVPTKDGLVVATNWTRPQSIKMQAVPALNNYKHYLKYIDNLTMQKPIHSWTDYQRCFAQLKQQYPYNANTIYEGGNH